MYFKLEINNVKPNNASNIDFQSQLDKKYLNKIKKKQNKIGKTGVSI